MKTITKTALSLLTAFFLSMISCNPVENKLELSIMSFNIRYGLADDGENSWQYRREFVFDVIQDHKPDILGLQEALHFQIEEVMTAGQMSEYSWLGFGREDGAAAGEYAAILYHKDRFEILEEDTFWFSETPHIPSISESWGNQLKRICTWVRLRERNSGSTVYIYNVHLDHESQTSRVNSVLLLMERIQNRSHPDPVIVIGDFNVGEDNEVIKFLKSNHPLYEVKVSVC